MDVFRHPAVSDADSGCGGHPPPSRDQLGTDGPERGGIGGREPSFPFPEPSERSLFPKALTLARSVPHTPFETGRFPVRRNARQAIYAQPVKAEEFQRAAFSADSRCR